MLHLKLNKVRSVVKYYISNYTAQYCSKISYLSNISTSNVS